MAPNKPELTVDGLLTEILSGINKIAAQGSTISPRGANFEGMIKGLDENVKALERNTKALHNLAMRNAGGDGGGVTNALPSTPDGSSTGHASDVNKSKPGELPPWRQALQQGQVLKAGEELLGQYVLNTPGRQNALLATSAVAGAIPAGRNLYNRIANQMQRSVDQRITEPTQIGMLAGAPGPGSENVGSSFGSYVSSFMAAPSLLFSGGQNAGMLGGLFGANMSQATQEGWQSRYRAFGRSLNPFDMLSYEQAMGINTAVAGKGFRSLGQQMNVEEALTDLVQSTAIDAGSALDLIDMSVKRLNEDVERTKDSMKEYGTLSKEAGKGVVEYTKEVTAALNMVTAGGAQGAAARTTAEAYSGVPQVESTRVAQIFQGRDFMGVQAATMAASGKLTPENAQALALGLPLAAGSETEMVEAQFKTLDDLYNMMLQGPAQGNERLATAYAASRIGAQPMEFDKMRQEGKRIVGTMKAKTQAAELSSSMQKKYGGTAAVLQKAGGAQGTAALKNLMGRWGGEKGEGFDVQGMKFKSEDPYLQDKVADLFDAVQSGNEEMRQATIKKWGGEDELAEAQEIVDNLMTIGRVQESGGNEQSPEARNAWAALNKKGISFGTGFMKEWTSSVTELSGAAKGEFRSKASKIVEDTFKSGAITEAQKKSLLKGIKSGEYTAGEFEKKITEATEAKAKTEEQGVKIELSGAAADFFKLVNDDPASAQGAWTKAMAPGYNPRTAANP